MEDCIKTGLAQMGLLEKVPTDAAKKLAQYGQMLLEKNKEMNLTAIRHPQGVATLHMLDSAAILNAAQLDGRSLIDVGTGAGFPGLVLAILVPTLKVTLLDSLEKRLVWLEDVCATLGVKNAATIHNRAEEGAHIPHLRGSYDVVTARAVSQIRTLGELCVPYLRVGGRFIAMKSTASEQEVKEGASSIAQMGAKLETSYDYTIPHTEIAHRILVYEKVKPSPKGFPRRWAQMQKKPL